MLGWNIETKCLYDPLPWSLLEKVQSILTIYPPGETHTSLKCWWRLLGVICSLVIFVPGNKGLFCNLQAVVHCYGYTTLATAVSAELADWHHLMYSLQYSPIRILDVVPPDTLWFYASNASVAVLGGGGCRPDDILWVCCYRPPPNTTDLLISW